MWCKLYVETLIFGIFNCVVTRDTLYPSLLRTLYSIDGKLGGLETSTNVLFLMCQSVGLYTRIQLTNRDDFIYT